MGLGHPSTMPIRQSGPLYPIWEEERTQHRETKCLFANNTRFRAVPQLNKEDDGKGRVVVLRSLLCWCTRMISAFSSDSSSGCCATKARIHCICGKSVWRKEEREVRPTVINIKRSIPQTMHIHKFFMHMYVCIPYIRTQQLLNRKQEI